MVLIVTWQAIWCSACCPSHLKGSKSARDFGHASIASTRQPQNCRNAMRHVDVDLLDSTWCWLHRNWNYHQTVALLCAFRWRSNVINVHVPLMFNSFQFFSCVLLVHVCSRFHVFSSHGHWAMRGLQLLAWAVRKRYSATTSTIKDTFLDFFLVDKVYGDDETCLITKLHCSAFSIV